MFSSSTAFFAVFYCRFCFFIGGGHTSNLADFREMLYEFFCNFHVSIFIGCLAALFVGRRAKSFAFASLIDFVDVLPEQTAVDRTLIVALASAPTELVLWNYLTHREDRFAMHAHFLRLRRSGEFGS